MNRIATTQTYASAILGIQTAQQRVAQAGAQVSSGKLADDLAGYASSARTLTAAQAVKSRIDTYIDTGARLADKLKAQDTALNAVADSATGARKSILDALASGDGTTLMQSLQDWFSQATSALNTDYQGSFLFSGGQGDTPPVDTNQVTDLPTGGAASHFKNGTLQSTDRLDDEVVVKTGFTASDIGGDLFNVLQGIVTQNTATPFTGKLTQAQQDYLSTQLQPLADAAAGVETKVAFNGSAQSRLDTTVKVLTDRQTAATAAIGGLTDADPAQAATNLQLAQTALQASAQVWQALTTSSLLNVLSTS